MSPKAYLSVKCGAGCVLAKIFDKQKQLSFLQIRMVDSVESWQNESVYKSIKIIINGMCVALDDAASQHEFPCGAVRVEWWSLDTVHLKL